jgi:phospholipid-binding lipoprotein MlaA
MILTAAALALAALPPEDPIAQMVAATDLRAAQYDPETSPIADAPPEPEIDPIANLANPDPLEGFNRLSYAITQPVDRFLIRPIALTYRALTPEPMRDGVHNALNNIFTPTILANDLLQMRPKRAWHTLKRFAINSTLGVAGLVDVARRPPFNLPAHGNGFSATLGMAGAGPGVYLYLPIIGPTTVRDVIGQVGDAFTQPLLLDYVSRPQVATVRGRKRAFLTSFVALSTTGAITLGVGAVDTRARADPGLQAIKKQSIDAYAALRSAYLQHRAGELAILRAKDGEAVDIPAFDDTLTDPEAPPKKP